MNIMFQRVKIFKKPVLTSKYIGRQTLLSFLFREKFSTKIFPSSNVRQKVVDKLTKVSKIDFGIDCFTAAFSRFFCQKRQSHPKGG